MLSRLAWFSYSNADFVVVGRMLGNEVLGAYTLAWNIASAPAEKFAGLVLSVAPAVLSDARAHAGEVRRMFLVMVQGVALVIFPLAVGLALVSGTLVRSVLGPEWVEAIAPLRLLADTTNNRPLTRPSFPPDLPGAILAAIVICPRHVLAP